MHSECNSLDDPVYVLQWMSSSFTYYVGLYYVGIWTSDGCHVIEQSNLCIRMEINLMCMDVFRT